MGPIYSLADFWDMVRRRLGLILAVTILGCTGSVFFALSQAHEYESSEVIQIEQPKISDELAQSTVESSAARRLQLIEQQLMARGNLLALMDEFDIYTNLPGLRPTEKVDLLRRSITITGVAAAREGFADDGAISVLTITARMDSPEKARAVAHALADATRQLATKQREEQTRETLAFFQNQERTLLDEITRVEAELATFRSENDISIEGSLEFRRSELSSLNDALLELDREIIAAQLELQSLDRSGNTRAATIERQQEELTRLLDSLTTQRQLLQDRRAALSASIETTPEVERTLADFDRRLDQLRDQLEEVSERRTAAEVGFSVESAARGERLMTLEEANLPDYPVTMSRKLMVAAGTVASILLGLGIAFLLELRRPVIRTARQMQRETGLMPVVSIPDTSTEKPRKSRNSRMEERRQAGLEGRAARLARNGGSTGR